ncbi:ABC transporter ATP-binding protein [Acidisoma cladoniae]|jgi:multiple sugar transport system ATP-binding protein|uniref:ABC transporter ATP-binding protein n=1 Tax=Acidisoma cladoniae TaxID=3040935 RepID=UPI00254BFA5F|nr:sn-glycerol-3-phosphate ABC transporter ATP-binding protein UgpC [Acidisoma sp. PAMC 29798]
MAQVSIRTLKKTYDNSDALAVKGINLEIADGEFVVLVGPSGCGKSTTLRMIAGLEDISSGEIDIDGRVVNDVPPRDRDIAMVFQNYALYPHMSVYDNMAFGLKLRKFPKADIKKRVEDAARILHLTPLLQRKPRALSGGQRQRVAMGRAIVRNPKVFLFDEPLSNLDAKLRVQMRTEIKKVHNAVRTTTVYVTHDQVEAMTLADRVVVMNQGLIEQVGPPQHLYHHPETRFVAGFIGSPGMNFIPCRVVKGAAGLAIELANGVSLPVPAERAPRYEAYAGKEMLFGIRPEHMPAFTGDNRPGFVTVDVDVDITEPMGMETVIYFNLAGTTMSEDVTAAPLCARIDPDVAAKPGSRMQLAIDMNNMHLIDPTTDKVV